MQLGVDVDHSCTRFEEPQVFSKTKNNKHTQGKKKKLPDATLLQQTANGRAAEK